MQKAEANAHHPPTPVGSARRDRGKRDRDNDEDVEMIRRISVPSPSIITAEADNQNYSMIIEDVAPTTAVDALDGIAVVSSPTLPPTSALPRADATPWAPSVEVLGKTDQLIAQTVTTTATTLLSSPPPSNLVSPLSASPSSRSTGDAVRRPIAALVVKSAPMAPITGSLNIGVKRPPSLILPGSSLVASPTTSSSGPTPASRSSTALVGSAPPSGLLLRPPPPPPPRQLATVKTPIYPPGSRKAPLSPAMGAGFGARSALSTPTSLAPAPGASAGSFGERLGRAIAKALATEGSGGGGVASPPTPTTGSSIEAKALEVGQLIALKSTGAEAQDVAKRICAAFKDPLNTGLREAVLAGTMTAAELVEAPEYELLNPDLKKEKQEGQAERLRNKNMSELKHSKANITMLFRCPKCGKSKCSMIHKQTRCGDEPMTALLTCMLCGKVFRRQA